MIRSGKKTGYRLLGAAMLCAAGAAFFLPFKISLVPFLRPKLEAWKKLGISAEKIAISPRGQIHARGVILGNRETCRIGELDLDVSLAALLKGRLALRRVQARGVRADWEKLDFFLTDLQRQIPAHVFRERLASFEFRGSKLEISALVPDQILSVDRVRLGLKWRPSLVANVEVKGLGISGFETPTFLPSVKFRFVGRPRSFRLEEVTTEFGPVGLEGWLSRDSHANLQGFFSFKKVDLKWLTRGFKMRGRALEGVFKGQVSFKLPAANAKALEASGKAEGVKVRVGYFPFQKDPLVREHMPVLRDARFDSLEVGHWRMDRHHLELESLVANGSPLSVEGGGRIDFEGENPLADTGEAQGRVYFNMTGHLTENYYQTLGPLVQSGIYHDSKGRASFRFRIVGDFEDQEIRVNKVKLSKVVKSLARGFKEKLRSLVEP